MNDANKRKTDQIITYYEKKVGKTLYRITCVYMGKFELGKALEDLTVKKILRDENITAQFRLKGSGDESPVGVWDNASRSCFVNKF